MKPNLGLFDEPPEWQHILAHFRGSELQNYFTKIVEDTIKGFFAKQNNILFLIVIEMCLFSKTNHKTVCFDCVCLLGLCLLLIVFEMCLFVVIVVEMCLFVVLALCLFCFCI